MRCKKCGSRIEFHKMKSGRLMPVEEVKAACIPDDQGDMYVVIGGEVRKAKKVPLTEKGRILAYVPHWGTCEKNAAGK